MNGEITPPLYCGVDIGGTSTRIGLFQTLDTPKFTLIARFLTRADYDEQIQQISAALEGSSARNLAGIGVSIGGRIAQDGRSVVFAPNMLTYVGRPFAQDLLDRFDCPVRLAHDTVCGLLAEKQFGPIREIDRCAYLTISTGTGAAFQLRKAASAVTVSIEFGHQILDGNTLVCLCGQTGCLETFTGGRQLELRLGRPVEQITDAAFWETFSEKLALGLVNLAQLTRVEEVAVSGAIALNTPFLLPRVQQKVDTMLVNSRLHLSRAFLQENAPLIGAVTLLKVPEDTILH